MTTREEAEDMALRFLERGGPHRLPNPIDSEEAFAAALVFIDLHKRGLVDHTNHGGGNVEYAINAAGRARISCEGRA